MLGQNRLTDEDTFRYFHLVANFPFWISLPTAPYTVTDGEGPALPGPQRFDRFDVTAVKVTRAVGFMP
jgi:hypothetical protein